MRGCIIDNEELLKRYNLVIASFKYDGMLSRFCKEHAITSGVMRNYIKGMFYKCEDPEYLKKIINCLIDIQKSGQTLKSYAIQNKIKVAHLQEACTYVNFQRRLIKAHEECGLSFEVTPEVSQLLDLTRERIRPIIFKEPMQFRKLPIESGSLSAPSAPMQYDLSSLQPEPNQQAIEIQVQPSPIIHHEVIEKKNDIELHACKGVKVIVAPDVPMDKIIKIIELLKDL